MHLSYFLPLNFSIFDDSITVPLSRWPIVDFMIINNNFDDISSKNLA